MFHIEFYTLPNGQQPIVEFLNGLDAKMRAKALHSISILEEFGNQLRQHRIMGQGDLARDFDPAESSGNAGILFVFPIFVSCTDGGKRPAKARSSHCAVLP